MKTTRRILTASAAALLASFAPISPSAHAQAPQYVVTDLGTLGGGASIGYSINSSGQVTGFAYTSGNSATRAFLYSGGSMSDLGALGGTFSYGIGINNSGQVAGNAYTAGNSAEHAFLYSGGSMSDLGTLNGTISNGYGINSSGQVTGSAAISGNSIGHAFLSSGGGMSDLGTLGGSESYGYGINNSGQVTGKAQISGNSAARAFLYSSGSMSDLGTLGGTQSFGYGINNSGQVTGQAYTTGNTANHAFLYSGGSMIDLGTLGGSSSNGLGINTAGQVTGQSDTSGNSAVHAFLRSGTTMYDVNNLVSAAQGVTNISEVALGSHINDRGQIAAHGTVAGGQEHAVLLTPRAMGTAFSGGLGDLPTGGFSSSVGGVSNGGTVVAGGGTTSAASGGDAYRWTLAGGMSALAVNSGSIAAEAHGVSADGNYIVGFGANSGKQTAFRSGPGGATTWLGFLLTDDVSIAEKASSDGSVVVGSSYKVGDYVNHAFRWTAAGGLQNLGTLGGEAQAQAVSGNGSVVAGRSDTGSNYQGFRWTQATGMVALGGYTFSAILAANSDGSVLAGEVAASGLESQAHAARWTQAGGFVDLGDLAGGTSRSNALGISDDGGIITGFGNDAGGKKAIVWDQKGGLRNLQSVLTSEYGADFTGWTLKDAVISRDAKAVAGSGTDPLGNTQAWNAQINSRTYRYVVGETYAGFHTSKLGGLGTSMDLVSGTATGTAGTFRTVTAAFTGIVAPTSGLVSDVVSVTGSGSDLHVVQLSYDATTAQALAGGESSVAPGWWNGTAWVNAVQGNSGSNTGVFVAGAYDGALVRGHYGLDTTNKRVWAVVDYSGEFAAIGQDGFNQWSVGKFTPTQLTDAAVSGASGNPDGDALSNLLEYGLAKDPFVPNLAPPADSALYGGVGYLRMQLQRDASHNDITIEVQAAGSLAGPWTTVASSVNGGVMTGTGLVSEVLATGSIYNVEARDIVPVTSATMRFLRVKVTH